VSSRTKTHFSAEKIFGSLFGLLVFSVLFGLGVRFIPIRPRLGWFATILFGTMCIVAVIEIVRDSSVELDKIPDVKEQLNVRRMLVSTAAVVTAIFLGIAENFISDAFSQSFPRPGVWFAAFVTTLAFYPLREEKHAKFKTWVLFCAVMGVVSVGFSYIKDWLENFLRA
jgi:hypothetical protein